MTGSTSMRLLIVDDDPSVQEIYRRSFETDGGTTGAPAEAFRGSRTGKWPIPAFDCTFHDQGLDAIQAVEAALGEGRPYSVAFIDVRMPPGIDGKETARRIRTIDPDIHLVIVTGYSDVSSAEIIEVAGPPDKLFYLAKPFEAAEVVQTAIALGKRWDVDRELADVRADLARHIALLEQQAAELAANEQRAIHVASHDALTDAPNRLAFQHALNERVRRPGPFAVAMVDLDRFKLVNDTLGHLAGDEMIRAVCAILQQAVPQNGLVARLGGDEFGLLFDTVAPEAALMACERIVAACDVSLRVMGDPVHGSVSAGVMVSHETGVRDPVDLMRRADLALNEAKRSGRNAARLFDESLDEGIRLRRQIESNLSQAIARDELSMLFQPIVATDTFEVVGFEALLRWHAVAGGPISPAAFIPIAEESNLIHELGDWVLARSLAVLKDWPGQYVSVNFSPRQFRRHNFVGYVMEQVQRANVAPPRLQIEITETAIFDDAERAADTMYRLRQMGFRIALDDFGTGYSSLYNIRKFALDSLKIDRSFIDGMMRERESVAIVHSIIHLGQALGLGVIAEGVETDGQMAMLRAAGASHLQGYLFAVPITAEHAAALAKSGITGVYAAVPSTVAESGATG
ncbi:GGDEF and EAL domain-containing protein [uncultured Sphingomonas sp.]|uniref:GGDEF and EAL domain-containing protein n=1 Tax=uncultured Sphingomonas sp. TaxID=158754 RepID=UPI0025EC0A8A|nr:GGDEF and EAL domain-containing protein [uncultured Sphingomonas sp.]